eukprot:767795-Hanusia_phi.AAC.1
MFLDQSSSAYRFTLLSRVLDHFHVIRRVQALEVVLEGLGEDTTEVNLRHQIGQHVLPHPSRSMRANYLLQDLLIAGNRILHFDRACEAVLGGESVAQIWKKVKMQR